MMEQNNNQQLTKMEGVNYPLNNDLGTKSSMGNQLLLNGGVKFNHHDFSNVKNLVTKMMKVRNAIQTLTKDQTNNQYNSVSSALVNATVREAMEKENLLLMTENLQATLYDDVNKSGNKSYLVALKLLFTVIDVDNLESMSFEDFALGQNVGTPEQAIGKAKTYGEKYFLMKLFQIPTTDDPDGMMNHVENALTEKPTKEELQKLIQTSNKLSQFVQTSVHDIYLKMGLDYNQVAVGNVSRSTVNEIQVMFDERIVNEKEKLQKNKALAEKEEQRMQRVAEREAKKLENVDNLSSSEATESGVDGKEVSEVTDVTVGATEDTSKANFTIVSVSDFLQTEKHTVYCEVIGKFDENLSPIKYIAKDKAILETIAQLEDKTQVRAFVKAHKEKKTHFIDTLILFEENSAEQVATNSQTVVESEIVVENNEPTNDVENDSEEMIVREVQSFNKTKPRIGGHYIATCIVNDGTKVFIGSKDVQQLSSALEGTEPTVKVKLSTVSGYEMFTLI